MNKEKINKFDGIETKKHLHESDFYTYEEPATKKSKARKLKNYKYFEKSKVEYCKTNKNLIKLDSSVSSYEQRNKANKLFKENKTDSETNLFLKYLDQISKYDLNVLEELNNDKRAVSTSKNKKPSRKKSKCQCKHSTKCLDGILNVCTKDKKCRKKPMKIKTLHKNYTRLIASRLKPRKVPFYCLW